MTQDQAVDPPDTSDDHHQIHQLTQRWVELWSPKEQMFNGQGFEQLFATEENGIIVFDNINGSLVVLHSVQEYLNTWQPVMAQLTFWTIAIEDNLQIDVSNDLAFTTFSFLGVGRDRDGKDYQVRQYGTHVWKRINGQWRLVHEHLTIGA